MNIPNTPEEFIQAMMKLSGMSRSEVEALYPHYLPARQVLKYTLKFTLKGIKPAIWRKIEVPSNITLRHLGDLIVELPEVCMCLIFNS